MEDSATTSGPLECVIVTPEATVLQTKAGFVALPLYDGELGIGLNHSPMIGRLGFGELRIRDRGEVQRYYVDGGFVQVADNVVSVLTNRAIAADEIDRDAAGEQLRENLSRRTSGTDEMAIRDRLISQARGQLRVAGQSGP